MYCQLTDEERYMISRLRMQGKRNAQIARALGRHRSTIGREIKRNYDRRNGSYCVEIAAQRTRGRRSRSRRNSHFCQDDMQLVTDLLKQDWSPEQIAGRLKSEKVLTISHETIYRFVWTDRKKGGELYKLLRQSNKQRRKRRNSYDSRGRLAGKRMIDERPESIERRVRRGHWEIDTVMGSGDTHCIVTLVERKTGYVLVGKLRSRNKDEAAKRTIQLIKDRGLKFISITSDNGTEFHSYKRIESETGVIFYFSRPYHSWERGTSENTNGLIRQYLPKGKSMVHVTQHQCNSIAEKLNNRPRKRHHYKTPREMMDAK